MNLSWFANVIVHHPFIILLAVTVFSGTCIVIPFTLKSMSFPKFQDPQMGFSTRGTIISNRLTAWANIIKSTSPAGELTSNPQEFLEIQNKTNSIPYLRLQKREGGKKSIRRKNKSKPIYGNVYISEERNSSVTLTDIDRWKAIHSLTLGPRKIIHSRDKDDFFLWFSRYAHLVVTSHNKKDLFTISNMLAMCRLENEFIDLNDYERLCIHNNKSDQCCKPWSLPNYIAIINNKASCLAITEEDIVTTKAILVKCSPYFHNMELNFECLQDIPYCGVPFECVHHDAVYNILNFLTSTTFLPPNAKFGEVPTCSTAMLPYYHELEHLDLDYDGIKVVAMDFGIKSALFDECLIRDTWLMGTGAMFVFICIWLYTQSLFLTIMTIIVLALMTPSFFVKYGISKKVGQEKSLMKIMSNTLHHAFVSMFVTVVTTYICGYSSCSKLLFNDDMVSSMFGNMGTIVLFKAASFFRSCLMVCIQRWCCFKPQWNLSTTWFQCASLNKIWQAKEEFLVNAVIKLKYLWLLLLMSIAIASGLIVFVYPKLQMPNTPDFQLFSSSHLFEKYDFIYKNHFWFKKPGRGAEQNYKLPLRFVWGVTPIDNGDYLDPSNLGSLVLDPTFDMSSPESQDWLRNFCQNLRQQSFYQSMIGPLLSNCFIETFVKSMQRKCYDTLEYRDRSPCCEISKFPFNKSVFDECIAEEMAEIYGTPTDLLNAGMAGPKFSKDQYPTIKIVIVEYDSSYSYSMSYEKMHEFYVKVETWMNEALKTAPGGMKNGWFISDLEFYDLQRELNESTENAVAISMGLALIVLFLSTLNILTSLYAIITISSSIFVTIAVLVLLGWKLNILESIAISTAIGLTFDFSLHYSVNYRMCPKDLAIDREAATRHALMYMAGPALMAAITTGAAGAFMMPSLILPYIQMGIFLVLVMCISWLYATFLLGSMLAIAGPDKNCGQFEYSKLMCCVVKSKRIRERPQPIPLNIPGSHELESLTLKRERPTPRPLRRSLSSGGTRSSQGKNVFTDQSPSATSAITILTADDN
ncbi:hypothetical protein NQ317_009916 [Molorchus minor]|uniref:Protein dispatched n=1 Tax=Molorchus minor TaxID=1323400 RepID=A0ABQ9K9L1_9CUCU|nr:hypothetical protein NQ317_009916 [Molorchus minor]